MFQCDLIFFQIGSGAIGDLIVMGGQGCARLRSTRDADWEIVALGRNPGGKGRLGGGTDIIY